MSASYLYEPAGPRREKVVTGGSYTGTTQYLEAGDDEIAAHDASPADRSKTILGGTMLW